MCWYIRYCKQTASDKLHYVFQVPEMCSVLMGLR